MSYRVAELDLGLDPGVHAQLAAEFPSGDQAALAHACAHAHDNGPWYRLTPIVDIHMYICGVCSGIRRYTHCTAADRQR